MDSNDFNPYNDYNEGNNTNNNPKKDILDDLINEIDNNIDTKKEDPFKNINDNPFSMDSQKNNIEEMNNNFIKLNIHDKYNPLDDPYDNNDNNDFSNPFKDFTSINENNNINNENNIHNNFNKNFDNDYDDKPEDDFVDPFRNETFEEKNSNKNNNNNNNIYNNDFNQNPYNNFPKENNNININDFPKENNNNININDFNENNNNFNNFNNNYQNKQNPDVNNIGDNVNDFSNPFKDEFGYNENYNQNNFNKNSNNNNFNDFNNNNNDFNNNNNNFNSNDENPYKKNISNNDINIDNHIIVTKIYKEIKIENNSKEYKTIEAIIKKCESLYYKAKSYYDNYNIKSAISSLLKINSTLSSLKITIQTKQKDYQCFLPQINSLESKSIFTLNNYRINLYDLISKRYKSINLAQSQNNEILTTLCSHLILQNPFISFEDVFNNNNILSIFSNCLEEANRRQKKCILLYGPRGSGKTLLVHALAQKLGANVAHVEGSEYLKIPYFGKEFVKVCFKNIGINRPFFVFMKNVEDMFNSRKQFDFIYDKVASSFKMNIYFIASTSVDIRNLPKDFLDKFQFYLEVNNVSIPKKVEYMRFICERLGININANNHELNNFVEQFIRDFSNKQIFQLIKNAINKKIDSNGQNEVSNWVYQEGLNLQDLYNVASSIDPYLK